jgi:hypothetical protein
MLILFKRGRHSGGGESVKGVKGAMGSMKRTVGCGCGKSVVIGLIRWDGVGWGGDDDDGVWISDVGKEGQKGVQRCCQGVADNDRDVGSEEESGAVIVKGWRGF